MKLKEFTVKNFRSISEAHKLPIDENFTVLLGKNNEGKSNLLKALALSFNILKIRSRVDENEQVINRIMNTSKHRKRSEYIAHDSFDWERDYPISKQNKKRMAAVSFRLDFKLSKEEQDLFKRSIGKKINEDLPICIEISKNFEISFNIPKKAYGSTGLLYKDKIKEISQFVCNQFNFIYIPAIRPANFSMKIIENLIEKEFEIRTRESDDYKNAQKIITKFTRNILDNISKRVNNQLQKLLGIQNLRVVTDEDSTETAFFPIRNRFNDYDIKIDDGVETSLYDKGDGLKSLIALALVKALNNSVNVFLAIEEPESHLHPAAIKKIKGILEDISAYNQVIISTHSPLLINRYKIKNNIIVTNKKAKSVSKIQEIRKELGVEISDNLISSEYVLIVEGESDRIALRALLENYSETLKKAFQSNKIIIDSLGGANNLSYKASIYTNNMCRIFCFIDNDKEGCGSIQKALDKGYICSHDYVLVNIKGYSESETEDMYTDTLYSNMLLADYHIKIPENFWKITSEKWSDRMHKVFLDAGKIWDDNQKKILKRKIAELVEKHPNQALQEARSNPFKNLKNELENMLTKENKHA